MVGLGTMAMGYYWTIYNQLFAAIKDNYNWDTENLSWIEGAINSVFILGAIVGCLSFSRASNYSRIKAILWCDTINILSSTLLLFTNTYTLFIGRFIQGIVTGINTVITPVYIREFVPLPIYEKMIAINNLMLCIGQILAFSLGAPIDIIEFKNYWRLCLTIPLIMISARLLFFSFFKIDTPNYYLIKSDEVKALAAFEQVYPTAKAKETLIKAKDSLRHTETPGNIYKVLKTKPNLKLVLLGVLYFQTQQFAGINVINFYSTKIFKDLNVGLSEHILTAIFGLFDLFSLVIGLFCIVDKFPRRKIYLRGTFVIIFILGTTGALTFTTYAFLNTLMIFGFIIVYSLTIGPLTWIVTTETTPNSLMGIPVTSHWVYNLLIAQLFPVLADSPSFGIGRSFWLLCCITIINFGFLRAYMKETLGMNKTDIYNLYLKSKDKIEIIEDIVDSRDNNNDNNININED